MLACAIEDAAKRKNIEEEKTDFSETMKPPFTIRPFNEMKSFLYKKERIYFKNFFLQIDNVRTVFVLTLEALLVKFF